MYAKFILYFNSELFPPPPSSCTKTRFTQSCGTSFFCTRDRRPPKLVASSRRLWTTWLHTRGNDEKNIIVSSSYNARLLRSTGGPAVLLLYLAFILYRIRCVKYNILTTGRPSIDAQPWPLLRVGYLYKIKCCTILLSFSRNVHIIYTCALAHFDICPYFVVGVRQSIRNNRKQELHATTCT